MKKQFTAMDCIHLFACRKVNSIANKLLFGVKGTQKMVRGCNDECACYTPFDDEDEIKEMIDELREYYNSFHKRDKR